MGIEEAWTGLRIGQDLSLLVWRNKDLIITIHALGLLSTCELWLEVLSSSLVTPQGVRGTDLNTTGAALSELLLIWDADHKQM